MIKIVKNDRGYSLVEDDRELTTASDLCEINERIKTMRLAAHNIADGARRTRDEMESRAAQLTAALMRGPE